VFRFNLEIKAMSSSRVCVQSLVAAVAVVAVALPLRAADAFDHYLNPVLAKAIENDAVKEVKQAPVKLLRENDRILPGLPGALLIVKTNEGRNCKLLVQPASQRAPGDKFLPMLLIDRYVTFREGEERAVVASGKSVSLFAGFRLNLDLGQIVPEQLGGDLRYVVDGDKTYVEPLGKAKLYLVTKHLSEATPPKPEKFVIAEPFEPKYFNGTYKLYDDGRRGGQLTLKVEEDGNVTGAYYSDKDGRKYEVHGKVGTPKHAIQFTVKFPNAEQVFQGYLFTGDGKALTGTSRMAEREAGFYALRVEE
jgi:hypothetical protein